MAMLMASYFIATEKPVPEGEIAGEQNLGSAGAPIKIGAAFIFVCVSSCLAWICNYAYYSVFGHPWEAFPSSCCHNRHNVTKMCRHNNVVPLYVLIILSKKLRESRNNEAAK